MKKLLYMVFAISLLHNVAWAQWVQQNSGVTTSLLDIDFINENTGWACGDGGVVVKTTNGGVNWVQLNTGLFKRLEGIDAVDANTVYSVGWFQTIIKSTNGGSNWQIIRDGPTGVGSTFFKCFFINLNTGWLLRSGGGYVLKTTNGGISFDSVFTNNSFNRDIYFKDANTGVICGDGAWIIRSTDGGVSWVQISLPLLTSAPNLYRISFVGNTGWTIGEGGESGLGRMVFRTTNFGISWDSIARVPYPNNELIYSVFFANNNTGYCGGTFGHIFKSTNGGISWYQQNVPINGFRNDFWFSNDTTGWVVGGGGYILKTTNGGTYVNVSSNQTQMPNKHAIGKIYPNPFNPETNIHFELAFEDDIKIKVYDMLGKEIFELINKKMQAGRYEVKFNGISLSSGIYICRLESKNNILSKTIVLLK
ncbi:MAG: T9SS type A sorting domain-containing protein [Ignavibacteria bacterium]|nr:T9SS type A sorting domain-containing protein [Ignavibacteria bacterium]